MPPQNSLKDSGFEGRLALLLRDRFAGNQTAMAKALGVSQASVSRAVRGLHRPSGKLVAAVARLTGMTEQWLLTGHSVPQPVTTQDASPRPHVPACLPVAAGILPGPPAHHSLRLQGETFPVPEVHYAPTRYWLRISDTLKMADSLSARLSTGDLVLMESDRRTWETDLSVLENKLCGLHLACEQDAVLLLARDGSEFALGNEHFVFRCQPPQGATGVSQGGTKVRMSQMPLDADDEEDSEKGESDQRPSRPTSDPRRHIALHEIVACYVYHISLWA